MARGKSFADFAKILVKAGNGGNGCDSYIKRPAPRPGIPNGGHGGNGGNVVIVADSNLQTLEKFQFNKIFTAKNGKHGSSNKKHGANADDIRITVPVGTVIWDGEQQLLYKDLSCNGDSVIIAKGGHGGRGNVITGEGESGAEGEQLELVLELLLDCDAGLIGPPNSGKSAFLAKLSNAKTKVAHYMFTTRIPVLAMLESDDFRFTCIDMPAIVPKSHEGQGVGADYIKHLKRCKLLYIFISLAEIDTDDPLKVFRETMEELNILDSEVAEKPRFLVVNKMDADGSQEKLAQLKKSLPDERIYPVSVNSGAGIEALLTDTVRFLDSGGMQSR